MSLQLPNLPNFNVNVPQMPSPLDTYGKMLQLKALQGQEQLIPLQVQEAQQNVQRQQLQNETAQIELHAKKAYNAYWSDPDKFQSASADFPHNDAFAQMLGVQANDPLMATLRGQIKAGVPADHAFADAKNTLQIRQEASKATQEQQSVLKTAFDQLREIAAPILAEKDATKKQQLIDAALPGLQTWAKFDPVLAQITPSLHAGNFDAFANRIGAEEKAMGFTKAVADAAKAAQEAVNATPEGAGKKAGAEAQARLDVESSPEALELARKKAQVEANARQAAAQGDPAVAGQLLANGSLTLADLKTRGSTPQFIEQATLAAQKIDKTYNPADEIISEHIAKSPAMNQFFGSANSLIGKGGTLDQLETLGRKIPQHDFPVLNTVDDWQKLARGKGPLAGYAATALGVADDYSKVMGGGQGSDTSRDQALTLFGKASSPEQRADAIAATRDAVQSQRDQRIGNNKFLKREYGVEVSKGTPAELPKSLTAAQITAYAQAHGVSEDEVKRQAKAKGIQVP
jgi:hypothetical protein